MSNTKDTNTQTRAADPTLAAKVTHGIMYVEAIKVALTNLEAALASLDALGYAVSAKISYGRIMSVGVHPKRD